MIDSLFHFYCSQIPRKFMALLCTLEFWVALILLRSSLSAFLERWGFVTIVYLTRQLEEVRFWSPRKRVRSLLFLGKVNYFGIDKQSLLKERWETLCSLSSCDYLKSELTDYLEAVFKIFVYLLNTDFLSQLRSLPRNYPVEILLRKFW